jgi:hypothetical protein
MDNQLPSNQFPRPPKGRRAVHLTKHITNIRPPAPPNPPHTYRSRQMKRAELPPSK